MARAPPPFLSFSLSLSTSPPIFLALAGCTQNKKKPDFPPSRWACPPEPPTQSKETQRKGWPAMHRRRSGWEWLAVQGSGFWGEMKWRWAPTENSGATTGPRPDGGWVLCRRTEVQQKVAEAEERKGGGLDSSG